MISWTPSREFKRKMQPRDRNGVTIDTVYSSFGQVYDIITPISLLRTIAALVSTAMYIPHMLKEVKSVRQSGYAGISWASYISNRSTVASESEDDFDPEYIDIAVVEGMWRVVNAGGTGARIRWPFDISRPNGKQAEVVGLGKDTGKNKDHSWFVTYAPAYKPEVAMVALIENSGFGGTHAAPAIRGVYDVYYRKTRHEEPPGAVKLIAKTPSAPKATAAAQQTAVVNQ